MGIGYGITRGLGRKKINIFAMRFAEIANAKGQPKAGKSPKSPQIPTVEKLAGIKKTERMKSVEELSGVSGVKAKRDQQRIKGRRD